MRDVQSMFPMRGIHILSHVLTKSEIPSEYLVLHS